jgi:signal transduction histidine kinase
MVVHDMRTPLTSILTGLETVLELGSLNEGQRECLDMAIQGGETLLTMINDVLDVSKMEEGSVPLNRAPLAVSELIRDAVAQVENLARAKGLALSVLVEEDLPEIAADRDKLCRTLVNLLGNAVKFTPRDGQLSVHASSVLGELRIAVADTGEGIPREAFSRIFEKFGQVEERREGRLRSTGLGLTFCKLAVEAHGGRISVESEPGAGSTFTFAIPVHDEAQKALPNPVPVSVVQKRDDVAARLRRKVTRSQRPQRAAA